jgi:hypothetical protein
MFGFWCAAVKMRRYEYLGLGDCVFRSLPEMTDEDTGGGTERALMPCFISPVLELMR